MKRPLLGRSQLDLRRLILLLALVSVLLMLINSLYASYRVQRQVLIDQTLQANQAYAAKVATSVSDFLQSAQQQLAYGAAELADRFHDPAALQAVAHRLKQQTSTFNSTAILDSNGVALATDPDLNLLGRSVTSPGTLAALRERIPLISPPYQAQTGRLLVLLSHPVFDQNQRYLGFVSGTIYLQSPSILNRLIGRHFHRDQSYIYVVDAQRQLLYHPDSDRVGTRVGNNRVVDDLVAGQPGQRRITNSQGIDMLAGYALVPETGWGIVAQRATAATLATLDQLLVSVLLNALPLTVMLAACIWWLTRLIAQPLRHLAERARTLDEPDAAQDIAQVPSWYFETTELKRTLLIGLGLLHGQIHRLHQDVQTDPLTGLLNRRALDATLERWQAESRRFSLIVLDIDHFKRVNDTYGHDVGDQVLQQLAHQMRLNSRTNDIICRVGGEEFTIVLPDTDAEAARQLAERLRQAVAATEIPPVGRITISLGVVEWSSASRATDPRKVADEMLYQAKRSGRNRVEVAEPA